MFAYSLILLGICQVSLSKTVQYDWSIDWVTASPDGFTRPVIGINGQWPCPQVDVDLGDRLIVTIHNNLGNESTGLHWHGLNQYGHADMDGSAGAAQCPVPPNSSFTYDFPVRAFDEKSREPALTLFSDTPDRDVLVPLTYPRSIPRWASRTVDRPRPQFSLPFR